MASFPVSPDDSKDMADTSETRIEVVKCRCCGRLSTSLKRFQLHIEKRRRVCDYGATPISGTQYNHFGTPTEMERVVLPLPRIRLMRLKFADIEQVMFEETPSVTTHPTARNQKRNRLEASADSDDSTAPPQKRTLTQADVEALTNRRSTASPFAKNKNCNPAKVNTEYVPVTPVPTVEVLKCRCCGILVTSMKRLHSHLGSCAMIHNDDSWNLVRETERKHDGTRHGYQEKIERVILPPARIRLIRLRSADIELIKSKRITASVVTNRPRQKRNRIDHDHAPGSDEVTSPLQKRTPRHASLKALSNIRNAASQIVKSTNCNPGAKPVSKSSRKTTSSRPTFSNQKRKTDLQLRCRSRMSSDEVFSVKCQNCTAFFDSHPKLEKHISSVHEDPSHQSDVHTCPICYKMVWKRLCFQSHLKCHTDAEEVEESLNLWDQWPDKTNKYFRCKHCLMPHTSHNSFLTHMEASHPDMGNYCRWTCKFCSADGFDSLRLLVSHIKNSHHKEYYGDTIKWLDGGNPKDEKKPRRACDICGKMFDIYYMKTHKLKHHNEGGTGQQKLRRMTEQNKYQCPLKECGAKLKTIPFLRSHFILHLQNNPFVCRIPGCGVKTDAWCHLDRHMRIHTGEQSVVCPKCGLSYARKDMLKTHVCVVGSSRVKQIPDGGRRARQSHLRLKRYKKSEIKDETEGPLSTKMEDSYDPTTLLKRKPVNISKIMMSDPVFIKACEENPDFKKLMTTRILFARAHVRNDNHSNGNISSCSCPECGKKFSCTNNVRRHCLSHHGLKIPYKNEATLKKTATIAKPKSKRSHVRRQVKYALRDDKAEDSKHGERNISRICDPIRIKVEPDLNIESDTGSVKVEDAMTEPAQIKVEGFTPIIVKTELGSCRSLNDNI